MEANPEQHSADLRACVSVCAPVFGSYEPREKSGGIEKEMEKAAVT